MPWHATVVGLTELIGLPVHDALEVHDTIVVEVLTWENLVLHPGRVNISLGVLPTIPPAKHRSSPPMNANA
jgi:hypothetical protein